MHTIESKNWHSQKFYSFMKWDKFYKKNLLIHEHRSYLKIVEYHLRHSKTCEWILVKPVVRYLSKAVLSFLYVDEIIVTYCSYLLL